MGWYALSVGWCYMSSLFILKIHPCDTTAIIKSIRQAYLLQWPLFLQYISLAVMQQLGYLVFYDKDTPIELSLL